MSVNIDVFFSERNRLGAIPSIPSVPSSEVPTVLNPPGSLPTTNYKDLGDVTDNSFIGKNGFVPVVVGENLLTLQPLPNFNIDGLISGGVVQWTGNGYIFNVSSAVARFQGQIINSSPDLLTLTTADPTNPRIDLFILQMLFDGNGVPIGMEADFITGTPAVTPVKPQIDPSNQIELTQVSVPALSTSPTLTEEFIYDENVEWTGSSSGSGTVNFASTNAPFQGTVSIEATNVQSNSRTILTRSANFDLATVQTLGFQIRLKATLGGGQNIGVSFLNSSGTQITNEINIPLDKGLSNSYQFIGIDINQFNFSTANKEVRAIQFRFQRASGSVTYSGYFLDVIKLEGGINTPVQFGSFIALTDTPSSYAGQSGKVVAVKSDESGLEFINGAGITGSGTTNEIAYFTGATAIASLSTATYPSLTELSYVKGVTSSIQTQLNGKPTTFLGLTDTPSSYASEANKWVRVNGTPDALVFDTVSPYDLDQEGATDGQVLAWSTANSRYQPVTPSGGSSKWTDVGSDIYRNSSVTIGNTNSPTAKLNVVQATAATPILRLAGAGNTNGFDFTRSGTTGALEIQGNQVGNNNIILCPTSGNVGIGKTTATTKLDIDGNFRLRGGTSSYPTGTFQLSTASPSGTIPWGLRQDAGESQTPSLARFETSSGLLGFINTLYANSIGTLTLLGGSGKQVALSANQSLTPDLLIDTSGNTNIRDGKNLIFSGTTGTKIGTETTQKIGFWNATPIIQPTNAIAAAAFVSNTSGIANDTATFGGYTIGQVVQALRNIGLLA